MKMYDKTKVKRFSEYVIEDYNRSLIIEDIATTSLVEKTDGAFTQIGIRPILDDDIFVSPSFSPELPSAGRIVAIGERDFLINTLLDKKEINKIEIKEDIKEFPKHIEFNDACIIISTKFYVEIFTKLMNRIDYEEKYPRLDYRYRIISVPEKVLGNKIIIMGKDAVLWEKQLFINKITGKKEKIDINIESRIGDKVAITLRSVNKIKDTDLEQIKILEISK